MTREELTDKIHYLVGLCEQVEQQTIQLQQTKAAAHKAERDLEAALDQIFPAKQPQDEPGQAQEYVNVCGWPLGPPKTRGS